MRKSAERILDNGKYKNIEEIYQRVFSPEDLVFLSNRKRKNKKIKKAFERTKKRH